MKYYIITSTTTALMLLISGTQASELLKLTSPAFENRGKLPIQFTCEGEGISPPLKWTGVPDGTASFVVIMDHQPTHQPKPRNEGMKTKPRHTSPSPRSPKPEQLHWYWTMYNIPAQISEVTAGQSVGTLGGNSVNNKNEYAPPCSKGPGPRTYTIHLYALSTLLTLTPSDTVSEKTLRQKMKGFVLGTDSLSVDFSRHCQLPPIDLNKPSQPPRQLIAPSTLPICKK